MPVTSLEVLRGIDLEVAPGEVVVIIGPSGSGKSTLLRCVCLLEPIQRGEVEVEGVPVAVGTEKRGRRPDKATVRRMRQDIGMVFQSFNLFPHLTALENITLAPRRVRGMAREQAEEQASAPLERIGLSDEAKSILRAFPAASSSGPRSPTRSPCGRGSCSSMRSPARSTRSSSAKCCASCASSHARA